MRLLTVVGLGLAVLVGTGVSPASAQSTDAAREEARQAFLRAQTAAEEERWADALEGFEQAYMLAGVPTALYNAAMVLRAVGRHKDARDAFQQLIDEHPDYDATDEARRLRDEEAARVAVLELVRLDPDGQYTIRLDGRNVPVDENADRAEIETDSGHHAVVAEREGYEPFAWEGDVADGQRVRIEVVMAEREVESRSLAPILVPIAIAVALAAGAVTAVLLQRNAQLEPETDNVMAL